jgi:hypothetical protein
MLDDDTRAGRSCPLHYRYSPSVFAQRGPGLPCEVLYVVGGLYGNPLALQSVLALFAREQGPKRLVFNGDFNWFNTSAATFEHINTTVLGFDATRGNVETELGEPDTPDSDAGCGCAYPSWVGDDVVAHSNHIMQRLRHTAHQHPALLQQLQALPMWLTAQVGPLRVAVVHGDAASLAGWGFAQEMLQQPSHQAQLQAWFDAAQVHAFACSHTCLPIFHPVPGQASSAGLDTQHTRWVLNNGAAGMPNFAGDSAGLLTRIALRPFDGPERRYGTISQGVHLDALAVGIDTPAWQQQFLAQWPVGSAAHLSYWGRIAKGPDYRAEQALVV